MSAYIKKIQPLFARIWHWWSRARSYLGLKKQAPQPLLNRATLRHFLDTRASHVAQTSLYGYLRTRAGQRYPDLFEEDPFIEALDIAKWHVWLDCLGDLSVYCGAMMTQQRPDAEATVARIVQDSVDDILQQTGIPAEAGEEFSAHCERLRERLRTAPLSRIDDGEAAFSFSPNSLVRWAPIHDALKQLDEEIVLNSVRFRWHEVRRDVRNLLDTDAILREAT